MSYEDANDKEHYQAFDLHYKATPETHRRIEAAWTATPEYADWAWRRACIIEGHCNVLDPRYQQLCKEHVASQMKLSKVVLAIIERELAAEESR